MTTVKTPLVGLKLKARPLPASPLMLAKFPVDDAALKSWKVCPALSVSPRY